MFSAQPSVAMKARCAESRGKDDCNLFARIRVKSLRRKDDTDIGRKSDGSLGLSILGIKTVRACLSDSGICSDRRMRL